MTENEKFVSHFSRLDINIRGKNNCYGRRNGGREGEQRKVSKEVSSLLRT